MYTTALGIGALLLTLACGTLWIRGIRRVALPKNRSVFLVSFLFASVLGAMALVQGVGWVGGVPAVFSIFVALFFTLTVAIGRQKTGEGTITVGASLPAFTAIDEHGETFDSLNLVGNPVLIKFFRGHW
ncbi:MAG: phosphoglycerol transferase MdoB-like AlkP superfamily enzyme [Oceanicoccus sp.]|jgi:phosphoglycerol transferase MdoB-like AlkP superfamily enzyme